MPLMQRSRKKCVSTIIHHDKYKQTSNNMKKIFILAIALISILGLSAQKTSYPNGTELSKKPHKLFEFSTMNSSKDVQLLPYRLTGRVSSDGFEEKLFHYDGYGRTVAIHESNDLGEEVIDSVTYDAAGNAIRVDGWQKINFEWTHVYYVCYEYNDNHQITQRTNFNGYGADDTFEQGGVYDYHYSDGKLVSHEMYFGNYGTLGEECYYSYNNLGQLIEEVYLQGFSTLDSSIKIVYSYNDAGKIANRHLYYYSGYSWDLAESDEYLYDENGNCIDHSIRNEYGSYIDRRLYEYNTEISVNQIHTPYNVPEIYLPENLSDVNQRTIEHWYTLDADYVLQYICDFEYMYNHTPVGISENESVNTMTVFPNPAQGSLNVIISDNQVADVAYIYDFQGKVCMQFAMNSGENNIDLSELSTGIYLLKVVMENGTQCSQKFIKQ